MSVADRFDEIVAAAGRKTAAATKNYERQVAVLGERVRVQAADDRHRRGVTRESVARGGAILLPADDIDLSPHSPIPAAASMTDEVDDDADEIVTDNRTASGDDRGDTGADSSFEKGWLTDR